MKIYVDKNGKRLEIGQTVRLVTHDEYGFEEDESNHIIAKVVEHSKLPFSLIDEDGDSWNEWLDGESEHIVIL